MDEPVCTRIATMDDIEDLVAWRIEVLDAVFGAQDDQAKRELAQENRRYYQDHLGRDHIAVFASIDGEIAGCGAICYHDEMPSPDNPGGRCGYVMNVYTRPAARGRGVGAAVMHDLMEDAHERRVEKVYLETTPAGRVLYEAVGFSDMPDMMVLARP